MKITYQKQIKTVFLILSVLIIPFLLTVYSLNTSQKTESNKLEEKGLRNFSFSPTTGYTERKSKFLTDSSNNEGFYAQTSRIYLDQQVNHEVFQSVFDKIESRRDTSDFQMNALLRMMYIDKENNAIEPQLKENITEAILGFKYWFTEPGEDNMIMHTENHMILFHTAELLAGQLFPNENFTNSGMTGTEHIDHALPLVNRWLEWKFRFGFSEWHSNTYMDEDLMALLNLVDFAQDNEIATKAAMLTDIIAFDFSNNFFKGRYATTHGRAYDSKKIGTSSNDPPSRDSIAEAAWIILGLGHHEESAGNSASGVFLATSNKYNPPTILEAIANDSLDFHEHRDRNSIKLEDGPKYGFGYEKEADLMFWWPMSAVFAASTIEASLNLTETYDINRNLVFEDEMLIDLLEISGDIYGLSISEVCELFKEATQGVVLEEANTYTYRTPYYQLSGAQDHQKALGGYQEHIWQASLDENATVFTNSHGGFRGEDFTGGFNPKATLHKNVGVIQYDRLSQSLILELVYMFLGFKPITQAYFPQWAFDDVFQQGKWTFGKKGESYVALFSQNPTRWISNYELISDGKKNLYIVELGSVEEYGTFENFTSSILDSKISIQPLAVGYDIEYVSPTRGLITVSWDDPMTADGQEVDLGPYKRHDNKYCSQEFNTLNMIIEFDDQILELDFENATKSVVQS